MKAFWMFEFFKSSADLWLIGLLVVVLIGPVLLYLVGPWAYRRDEICGGLSTASVDLYFDTFHQSLARPKDFATFYRGRFGRRNYLVPTLVVVATGWVVLTWIVASLLVDVGIRQPTTGLLPTTAVLALAGAYLWVVIDLMTRWRFRDLGPTDLWRAAWRLIAAVPLAYAVGAILQPGLAGSVAFFLGAFPTRQVTTLVRRLGRRQLGLGADADEKSESELEKLQGIDTRIAERFADEGITTIGQLAYADPVELTMRCASFAFSFVMDCQNQALAWIYFEQRLDTLRQWSLRGAQEIANLISELDGDDPADQELARRTIDAAARMLSMDANALERTLREIADDPYTTFINAVWNDDSTAELKTTETPA